MCFCRNIIVLSTLPNPFSVLISVILFLNWLRFILIILIFVFFFQKITMYNIYIYNKHVFVFLVIFYMYCNNCWLSAFHSFILFKFSHFLFCWNLLYCFYFPFSLCIFLAALHQTKQCTVHPYIYIYIFMQIYVCV